MLLPAVLDVPLVVFAGILTGCGVPSIAPSTYETTKASKKIHDAAIKRKRQAVQSLLFHRYRRPRRTTKLGGMWPESKVPNDGNAVRISCLRSNAPRRGAKRAGAQRASNKTVGAQ